MPASCPQQLRLDRKNINHAEQTTHFVRLHTAITPTASLGDGHTCLLNLNPNAKKTIMANRPLSLQVFECNPRNVQGAIERRNFDFHPLSRIARRQGAIRILSFARRCNYGMSKRMETARDKK